MSSVEIQGHRGFGDLAPHNTIAAFRAAARHAGTASVEFDVRRSVDGHLVVTHGPEVGPYVEKATLAELQRRDLGSGERVPLLAAVVDECLRGGLLMNVELKGGEGLQNVSDTIQLLREKGALPSCRISSFDRDMLKQVMKLAPEVPVGALYHPGTGPKDPRDPSKGVAYEKAPADFASWFESHRVPGDSVNLRAEAVLAYPALIREARRCGKQVMVWFPCKTNVGFEDGEAMYKRLLEMQVDVICCNRPDILAEVVNNARGQQASRTTLVQDEAPDFSLMACMPDDCFEEITLSSFKGSKYVVLYTYPADFTFVCASELVVFSKMQKEFEARDCQVLGMSVDTEHAHKAWKNTPKNQGGIGSIAHPLLADVKKEVAAKYGCLLQNGLCLRAVYIIDKAGVVRCEMKNDLPLGRNVGEALRILDALQFHERSVAEGKVQVCPCNWRSGAPSMTPTTEGVADYFRERPDGEVAPEKRLKI